MRILYVFKFLRPPDKYFDIHAYYIHITYTRFLRPPEYYFKEKEELVNAKTDLKVVSTVVPFVVAFEFLCTFAMIAFFAWYGSSQTYIQTEILDTLQEGSLCTVLGPKNNQIIMNTSTAESAQYASYKRNSSSCQKSLLSEYDVCGFAAKNFTVFNGHSMTANNASCFDVILAQRNRFCFGSLALKTYPSYNEMVFPSPPLLTQASSGDHFQGYYFVIGGIFKLIPASGVQDNFLTQFLPCSTKRLSDFVGDYSR